MAISRNGWNVYTSYSHPKLVDFPWVTGKVRNGDHFVVLDYIARRINNEVEKITKAHSWGHNPRPVRGYTDLWSEHATGTAFDFNAPKHGLNVPISKSFTPAQIKRMRQIIKDVQGAARWGGEWKRPDGMHVELIGGNVLVGKVADQIRAGKLPGLGNVAPTISKPSVPKPPAKKPAPAKPATSGNSTADNKAIQVALNKMGINAGIADGVDGPLMKKAVKVFQKHHGLVADGYWGPTTQAVFDQNVSVQKALRAKGYTKQIVDGYLGAQSEANIRHYQKSHGLYVDGQAGPKTRNKLGA